jgi:arsenate reductase
MTVHNALSLHRQLARSILAEALVGHWGRGNSRASARAARRREVHPSLSNSSGMKMPTDGMRSKSWEEFAKPGAPTLDFVFTVATTPPRKPARYGRGNP